MLPDLTKEFLGRRAVVTGGSQGIGAAVAQRLLDGGAQVVVTARHRVPETPDEATFVNGDLASLDGVGATAGEALEVLGGCDILVNNAGSMEAHPEGAAEMPDEAWQDSIDINFLSAVRMTAALMPALRRSDSAAIVNVSSAGLGASPGPVAHYRAAKAALNTYTRSLAQELAPQGIRVTIVTPGPVHTPGADKVREAMGNPPEASAVPLGRLGEPSEVAELVAMLASDRGRWMTGANYYVDGGARSL
ncbi:oxidoreductase [Herbidospora sp. RD11066]